VTAHFLYLILHGVRNSLKRQARRMRSPRYGIAAAVGLLYFFWIFGGWMPAEQAGAELGGVWLRMGAVAGPLVIALLSVRWWVWRSAYHGLRLSPAETHLLLPAPITRSQVIRFKILQAQPAILLSSVIASFFTRGTALPWPLRLVSIWVMLATLHQHQIAASLVQTSAEQHGRRGIRANIIPLTLFVTGFGVLLWSLVRALADIRATPSMQFTGERLLTLLGEPGPRIVLAPFRLLLAPVLATDTGAWPIPFAGALVVLLLHYLWVIRTDAAFEESAAERGARIARLAEAVRTGGVARMRLLSRAATKRPAPWLPLAPAGRTAYAVFWKNVLHAQRAFGGGALIRIIIIAAFIIFLNMTGAGAENPLELLGGLLLVVAGIVTVLGPIGMRNDLRTDLGFIDLLRTLPLRGRDLVGAGIAAATLCITVPQLMLAWSALVLLALAGALTPGSALLFATAALCGLPIINALAILIQNALALLYPTWVRVGEARGGVEVMGQTLVTIIGTLLLLALLSILPLIAGGIVGGPLIITVGAVGIIAGAAAALLTAAGEVVLLTMWLGRLYDRTDPVAAGLLRS
jgi:ABC-2 type transport system permease protein